MRDVHANRLQYTHVTPDTRLENRTGCTEQRQFVSCFRYRRAIMRRLLIHSCIDVGVTLMNARLCTTVMVMNVVTMLPRN